MIGTSSFCRGITKPNHHNIYRAVNNFSLISLRGKIIISSKCTFLKKVMKKIIKLNFLSLLNALQTLDLTRLMVYGFTEFADDFFGRYPNYYIWPRRINGSALETIFGQLKFSMGGHLSECS